jgi:NADH dehydrogenase FAD-containing subunit
MTTRVVVLGAGFGGLELTRFFPKRSATPLTSCSSTRATTEIASVMPFGTPIPPSPDTSRAILAAFCRARHQVREGHASSNA